MRPEKFETMAAAIHRIFLTCFAVFFFLLCSKTTVQSQEFQVPDVFQTSEIVDPAKVYRSIKLVRGGLDALRLHMGTPDAVPLEVKVTSTESHDIYFQALALSYKINRLSFEMFHGEESRPSLPEEISQLDNSLLLTEKNLHTLHNIMDHLHIPVVHKDEESDAPITIPQLLNEFLIANRQINLLLERHFSANDTYKQVMLAIGYTARNLARYDGVIRIPPEPDFEPGKIPFDVYTRLLDCLEIISTICGELDLEPFSLETGRITPGDITPSDSYDMAIVILARLDLLHKKNKINQMPREVFYPGPKYPSDVYQLSGILLQQLQQLEYLTKNRIQE